MNSPEGAKPAGSLNVAVVGLGYVGLPLAVLCVEKGHHTLGLDTDPGVVDRLRRGKVPFGDASLERRLKAARWKLRPTTDETKLRDRDVVIVCVPTPVSRKREPDLGPLRAAARAIADNLQPGQLIIVESSIYPGAIEEHVLPVLEKSGLKAGEGFMLAHSPERVDPGNPDFDVGNIRRVVGGLDEESGRLAAAFYRTILSAEVRRVSGIRTAEAVKMVENAFRDVNIAFANEMAMAMDRMGIDAVEVIDAAARKPFAFMAHYPGAGVGGHCIPVDPYYLMKSIRKTGMEPELLSTARSINTGMPLYTVQRFRQNLKDIGKPMKNSLVGVLGLSYKPGVRDTRESPAFEVIKLLRAGGAKVFVYDPYVPDAPSGVTRAAGLNDLMRGTDHLVLVTAHKEFRALTGKQMAKYGIRTVVDGRNFLDREDIRSAGIIYRGIGT